MNDAVIDDKLGSKLMLKCLIIQVAAFWRASKILVRSSKLWVLNFLIATHFSFYSLLVCTFWFDSVRSGRVNMIHQNYFPECDSYLYLLNSIMSFYSGNLYNRICSLQSAQLYPPISFKYNSLDFVHIFCTILFIFLSLIRTSPVHFDRVQSTPRKNYHSLRSIWNFKFLLVDFCTRWMRMSLTWSRHLLWLLFDSFCF